MRLINVNIMLEQFHAQTLRLDSTFVCVYMHIENIWSHNFDVVGGRGIYELDLGGQISESIGNLTTLNYL